LAIGPAQDLAGQCVGAALLLGRQVMRIDLANVGGTRADKAVKVAGYQVEHVASMNERERHVSLLLSWLSGDVCAGNAEKIDQGKVVRVCTALHDWRPAWFLDEERPVVELKEPKEDFDNDACPNRSQAAALLSSHFGLAQNVVPKWGWLPSESCSRP
jgi:hypothetical protein